MNDLFKKKDSILKILEPLEEPFKYLDKLMSRRCVMIYGKEARGKSTLLCLYSLWKYLQTGKVAKIYALDENYNSPEHGDILKTISKAEIVTVTSPYYLEKEIDDFYAFVKTKRKSYPDPSKYSFIAIDSFTSLKLLISLRHRASVSRYIYSLLNDLARMYSWKLATISHSVGIPTIIVGHGRRLTEEEREEEEEVIFETERPRYLASALMNVDILFRVSMRAINDSVHVILKVEFPRSFFIPEKREIILPDMREIVRKLYELERKK